MVEQKSKEDYKLKLYEILILMSMNELSLEPSHALLFTYRPRLLSGQEDSPESCAGVWTGEPAVGSVWPSVGKAPAQDPCGPVFLSRQLLSSVLCSGAASGPRLGVSRAELGSQTFGRVEGERVRVRK